MKEAFRVIDCALWNSPANWLGGRWNAHDQTVCSVSWATCLQCVMQMQLCCWRPQTADCVFRMLPHGFGTLSCRAQALQEVFPWLVEQQNLERGLVIFLSESSRSSAKNAKMLWNHLYRLRESPGPLCSHLCLAHHGKRLSRGYAWHKQAECENIRSHHFGSDLSQPNNSNW